MTDAGSANPMNPQAAPSGAASAPGWYPDASGTQQYWDGQSWASPTAQFAGAPPAVSAEQFHALPTSDDKTLALVAHLGGILTGFLAPLIVWVMKKDESAYLKHHSLEALNFQITLMIGWFAAVALAFVLIGFLLIPVLFICQILFPVLAAVKANSGEAYEYPISWRLIK